MVFATHSLQRDPPFLRLHRIACRNLLICLDRELQNQLMAIFRYPCRDDGWLFLGTSETAHSELFRAIDKQRRIYRPVERPESRRRAMPDLPTGVLQALPKREVERRRPDPDTAAKSHRAVLEKHAPPSILSMEKYRRQDAPNVPVPSETPIRIRDYPADGEPPGLPTLYELGGDQDKQSDQASGIESDLAPVEPTLGYQIQSCTPCHFMAGKDDEKNANGSKGPIVPVDHPLSKRDDYWLTCVISERLPHEGDVHLA